MSSATSRESDKFMLRLPDGMRDHLKKLAAKSGRSLNAEIVHRLEVSIGWIDLPEIPGLDKVDTIDAELRELRHDVEIYKLLSEKLAKDLQELPKLPLPYVPTIADDQMEMLAQRVATIVAEASKKSGS